MKTSIRQQTLLIALMPMLLVVILLDGYFLYSRLTSIESGNIERAELLAKQLGSSSEYAIFAGNTDLLNKEVTASLKQKDIAAVSVLDRSGKVLAYSGDSSGGSVTDIAKTHKVSGVVLDTANYFWLKEPIVAQAIELSDFDGSGEAPVAAAAPSGYVLIKMSKQSMKQEQWRVVTASLLISLLMVGLTTLIVLRLSRRIVNPIMALNRVAHRIGEGDLDMRISPAPVIRELNELAQGLNGMAKQLQQEKIEQESQKELLQASEERLNEIISTMPVALFIKDAQSRVTLMNVACEAQWGILFSNIVGTDGSRFFPPEQVSAYLEADQQVFSSRKMLNIEETVWNASTKQNRTLQTFKKPIYDKGGNPLHLICMSVDISERKQAETQLRQFNEQLEARIEQATRSVRLKKEEAESANHDKTRFLAAASHDLRQPMHALGLFVGELQSKLTTPEQRKIVDKVEESVEALSNLLDALLDISKLDAGVVTPNISTFSIGSILLRIAQNYGPLAQQKDVALRVIANHSMVHSDPILLERMLANLVSNAIRYTPIGGSVALACRNRGGRLCIEIRDNGIGIEKNEQLNIFQEFVQLANNERDRSKGLGLGLAIVNRIALLLKHEILLRSEPDKGSVFVVCVPKVDGITHGAQTLLPAGDQTNEEHSSANEFDQLNVLVIDDDALVRKSTQGIIESWGCDVSTAASFTEVKESHHKADYGLVICDYRLPDGDGVEVAGWIKSNFTTQPLFILISGDTSPDVLQRVSDNDIQLLHKPVRPAKLRSLIQFLLKQQAE